MKFSCNQAVLAKALNIVSKAVTARTTIPILKGILLEAGSDGKLKMAASDLDISIEKEVDADVEEPGSVVVYAKLFGDIIRRLPGSTVTLESSDEKVMIRCSNSEFNIVGMAVDEFPGINTDEDEENPLIFDSETLKEMIRKTSFSASIDESRGVITGVLIETGENNLNMVALDGFRMAVTRENMTCEEKSNVVIPAKTFTEISKIISETELEENEKVRMSISEKRAVFSISDTKVVLRLLDGEFIRYRDILPKENTTKIVINRDDFLESIERASLFAKVGKNNLIKLEISDKRVEITSHSEEGNVKEEVVIAKDGKDLTIGFNAKYLMDALKVIDDEEVVMLFNTSISPCLIEPMEGNSFEYLILPVRITNS